MKGQHETAGNWPKHGWSRRPGEVKVQDRGHVSLLLWGILLVLAWLSCDTQALSLWGCSSSQHCHGAQAVQGPFLGRAAQAVLDLSLHLLSLARGHPSSASPSSSGTTFPSPSSQPASTASESAAVLGQPKLGAGLPSFPK